MGDPKKLKKKYSGPLHPWNRIAIDEERVIKKNYGLKNKKEIYIATSFLKKYKDIAKKLIANKTLQGEKEKQQMIKKMQKYGLIQNGAKLEDVLSLQVKDILDRRIQSLLVRRGLSRTMKQARQYISHRHVRVGDKEINSPSYLVTLAEEGLISFKDGSSLADVTHPERVIVTKEVKKEVTDLKTDVKKFADQRKGRKVMVKRRTEGNRGAHK